ncbi:hypothetical protein ACIRST_24025 [Kitasatospora sp. NPDC101447]|uniref:hypothetical protein n=1 Tax=Kitasatospora sp. NPDC101447 TaxID=3364102 RepID=UPI00382A3341
MTTRRSAARSVAALALALPVLAGCGAEGAAPAPAPAATVGAPADATGAFDPAVAIAHRSKEPYAATLALTSETLTSETGDGDAREVFTVTGRVNHNTPAWGSHTEERTVRGGAEVVAWTETLTVDGVVYQRDRAGGTGWRRDPESAAGFRTDPDVVAAYAELLLDSGPAARKGMETESGVPVFHLGARLSPDLMRRADPSVDAGAQGGGAPADCDLWIDRLGRPVRVEQAMVVDGTRTVTDDRFSDFGPPETFAPPLAPG